VLVVKYRRKVITKEIGIRLQAICENITQKWDCEIAEFVFEEDHIHLLITAHPSMDLSVFVNNLKTVTSRMIRKEYNSEIKKKLWGNNFWTRAYCLLTTGGATIEVIRRYIEKQGGDSSPPKSKILDGEFSRY
jgi:putative transposase